MFEKIFRKKMKLPECNHEYEEVGRYFEENISEYHNGVDFIEGHIVRKCKKCGFVSDDIAYEKGFHVHRRDSYRYDKDYSISVLIDNGFIEKTKFDMKK